MHSQRPRTNLCLSAVRIDRHTRVRKHMRSIHESDLREIVLEDVFTAVDDVVAEVHGAIGVHSGFEEGGVVGVEAVEEAVYAV